MSIFNKKKNEGSGDKTKQVAGEIGKKILINAAKNYMKPFLIMWMIIIIFLIMYVASVPNYTFNSMHKVNPMQSEAQEESEFLGIDQLIQWFKNLVMGEKQVKETSDIQTVIKHTQEIKIKVEEMYKEELKSELAVVKETCNRMGTATTVYSYSKTIEMAKNQIEEAGKMTTRDTIFASAACSAKTENFVVSNSNKTQEELLIEKSQEEEFIIKEFEEDKHSNRWLKKTINRNELVNITIVGEELYAVKDRVEYYYLILDIEKKYFENDYDVLLVLNRESPVYPKDDFSPTVEEYVSSISSNTLEIFSSFSEQGEGSIDGEGSYYPGEGEVIYIGDGEYGYPLEVKGRVTSPYGGRNNPIYGGGGAYQFHPGIDVAAACKVLSISDGYVMAASYDGSRGNTVKIRHDSGLISFSQHLRTMYVKQGEKVKRGQVIGFTGNTGASTGIHLHFELYSGGLRYYEDTVNPEKYIQF